jgi:hypothetical protein
MLCAASRCSAVARIVRASEVGEYCYCARAWWLRHIAGLTPAHGARRDAGAARHARHALALRLSIVLRTLGVALLIAAALVALALRA